MAFLRHQPVRYKTVVNNNCLQQVRNFKYLNCEVSYENEHDIEQKLSKFPQILGILNDTSKPTLVPKFSRIKYIIHWRFPFFYMEAKFGPL